MRVANSCSRLAGASIRSYPKAFSRTNIEKSAWEFVIKKSFIPLFRNFLSHSFNFSELGLIYLWISAFKAG